MTITNRKEMKALNLIQVWSKNETVLVLFIRVTRNESNGGCKSELCNYIIAIVGRILTCTTCIRRILFSIRLRQRCFSMRSTTFGRLSQRVLWWAAWIPSIVLILGSTWLLAISSVLTYRRIRLLCEIAMLLWLGFLRRLAIIFISYRHYLLLLSRVLMSLRTKWFRRSGSVSNRSNLSIVSNLYILLCSILSRGCFNLVVDNKMIRGSMSCVRV